MLHAMSAWGTNVSEPLTELLGRDAPLERTHALLDEARWITILGPAGVGKSRFLLAVAAGVTPRDAPGGVWRCSLSGADTEREVCARIAAVLPHVDPRALPQDGDALAEVLPDACLLLLDDAEHAVPVLSAWLPRWLARAPHLRCLVGTRERLGGSGEIVVRLEPLHPDDAARLFEQRAEAARGAPLRPEERSLVSALIHLLDRLPLALELAAAQLAALSAHDLLASLEQHTVRLASPDRAVSPRHASLEAALDLSWGLLDDVQREAMSALALFESSPDLEAIESVLPPETSAPAMLAALGDRSWLLIDTHDETNHYRLLGVVRAYVRERSDVDAKRTARWVAYVARRGRVLLDAWGDRASTVALCRLAPDLSAALDATPKHDGLALELAVVLAQVAMARGPVPETLARLDEALHEHDAPSAAHIDALLARGRLRARDARPDESRRDYERALAAADALGDASRAARAAASLADHLRHHGDTDRAEALYRRALAALDDLRSRARLTASLAGLVAERGDLAEAEELYGQAVASARAGSDVVAEAAALQNLGLLVQERGDLDRAESLYRKALALHTSVGQRRFEAIAHLDLSALALERSRAVDAKREAEAASALAARAGDQREHAIAEMLLAVALATLDELEAADTAFARASALVAPLDEPGVRSAYAIHQGHLALAQARAGDAEAMARARAALQRPAEGDDARMAERVLESALRRAELAAEEARVARDGSRIVFPSGEVLDLASRETLRGIVAALADALRRDPDASVSADALIAAGWPESRSTTKSAKNRLHVALATLRKLGLAHHLERTEAGYRLAACRVGDLDET